MASEPRLARDRVTLADIAAAAGVSVPTVSKVLNGHADVAPKTRSRVEGLLADYNYAAPRRAGRSCLIDLVFADLSPWAVEIIRGAEEAASAEGCRIAVSVVSGEPDTEQWLTRLSTSQTNGVILVLTELCARLPGTLVGAENSIKTIAAAHGQCRLGVHSRSRSSQR